MAYRKGSEKQYEWKTRKTTQPKSRQTLLMRKPGVTSIVGVPNPKYQSDAPWVAESVAGYTPFKPLREQDVVIKGKIIRKELAEKFPNVKFRVTTERYSMGESVKVFWTDGPASDKVDPVVKKYEDVSTDPVTGETLAGGNSYAFAQRTISEKVKKMETDEARKMHACMHAYASRLLKGKIGKKGYVVVGFFLAAKADHTPGLNTVTSMTTATITIIPMVKRMLSELTGLDHHSPSCCIRPFG